MKQISLLRVVLCCIFAPLVWQSSTRRCLAAPYLDNQTVYSNQDPLTETRRSDHFRLSFGHYDRDGGMGGMSETMAQGNLQMYEQMWNRWVVEMGLHDINESATNPDGKKYRANFVFLMTWDDGGGGGAYSTMDANGYFWAMANPGYCRWDPPSGATPHEFGHVWEGTGAGFNGTDSSGAWWECTANWMQLQFLNSYPQAGGYLSNSMYYPAHGRDYYDSFLIWEAAHDDPRYGAAWVNTVWSDATPDQQAHEFIIDRMIRVDTSGSADKAGAVKDLWGDMAKKCITQDFERQRWLAQANSADDGSNWDFYQRCRTPLVKMPGMSGWFRPERSHTPMEFGFNMIPLAATPGTTVSCDFQPDCDPVRQSDWRACLVAVSTNGDARYSSLWNKGAQAMNLSLDETKLYLVVIATPKPMKGNDWNAYLTDAGLQFPYRLSFTGATPKNVIYPVSSHSGMTQHANGGGWKSASSVVDATAFIGPNAQVLGSARVRGYSRIEDYAVVRDSAQVRDYAVVSGHALVEGNAQVYGNAKVRDWGHVFGYAEVYENAKVIEHANCGDGNSGTHTKVYGAAIVKGTSYVYDTSTLAGCIILDGDTANGNGATNVADHGVHFGWGWGQDTGRFNGLADNGYIYAQHTFEKDNAVFAMDQFGINHGFLINGCRVAKDTVAPTRGGWVLPLDGVSQYVELHNSVNDFKNTAITIWAKWTGSTTDQRIWSMGDGAGKAMYLTPSDATTGGLRFVVTDGVTTETLDAPAAMPINAWTHVAVVFSGATSTLYVNGSAVASNPSVTLYPDSLNAPLMENANYLGRGNAGNYFQGHLDDFRVYMKALTPAEVAGIYSAAAPAPVTVTADNTPPEPNAATWLVAPNAISDSSATMSATPGTDASGWVEYYFTCATGGGHDSGWVSFNKYTDVGLTPGIAYSYTVKMRDRAGNETTASSPGDATTPVSTVGTGSFSYGPIGISSSAITMTAALLPNASGQTEYLFSRSGKSSGWQSSPKWTDTGLPANGVYMYTVQMRDSHGNAGFASAAASATAADTAAPILPRSYAQWGMLPYATIDNKVSMTAQSPTTSDNTGIQYYFHCASGNGPDSAWQGSATYVTSARSDGTYTYSYKVRDAFAHNESPYSVAYGATITPTSGYHSVTFASLATQPDDNLVTFSGTVIGVNADNYLVRDSAGTATIKVKPSTYGQATSLSLAFKIVTVSGHMYTLAGSRVVTYATVTATGTPTYSISGNVTKNIGGAAAGATVYFSTSPNASLNPNGTATTDASGNYSMPIINGTWYVCAGGPAYTTSADRVVVMNSANISGINFTLAIKPSISGKVTNTSAAAVSGATVCFSSTADAAANPVYTVNSDASGNYTQVVPSGVWYVCAGAKNYQITVDQAVNANAIISGINFVLPAPAPRSVPRSDQLLFSAVTDVFPVTGLTGNWPTYLPSGGTLTALASPSVQVSNRVRWEKNNRLTTNDGYNFGRYASAIPVDGVTIVAAIRPTYCNPSGEARGEIVDIFYDRLALAISHADGRVMVTRNYWNDWGPSIPNGRKTVLSLVVQTDGSYTAYSNGSQIMTGGANGNWTSINPDHTAQWGSDPDYTHYVSVGRNYPDGWSAYNGNIGDVFVYKVALTDEERQSLENDLMARFGTGDPYTLADATKAISIWAGLQTATTADAIRLNVETAGASIAAIDGLDAVRIARKVTGLDPNP